MYQRTVIKPQLDVPFVVRLDRGCEGQEKQGERGVYYQYTCNGNKDLLWLPREGRDAVLRTGARPGSEIEIVKMTHGNIPSYSAKLMSHTPEPAPRKTNGLPARAYYQASSAAPEPCWPESVDEIPPQQPQARGPVAVPPRPSEPRSMSPTAQHLAKCLEAAVDAAAQATEYGRGKGLGLTFLGSDIRAIALSIYIGDTRNGGMS